MTAGARPAAFRPLLCCLSAYGRSGGIQRFNQRVISCLGERFGKAARVHVLGDGPGDVPAASAADVVPFSGRKPAFLARSLGRAMAADLLVVDHVNLLPLATAVRLLRPRLPILMFAHGIEVWGESRTRKAGALERVLMRHAPTRIACVSRYTAARMRQAFGLPSGLFSHFPNAVDGVHASGDRKGGDGCIVLTVSRLDAGEPYKNVDTVIEAVAALAPERPGLRLEIVGDGSWRPALERLARSAGAGDRVRFLGRVSDAELAEAYGRASLACLPSTKEGFGIAYLEAWQHGLPVIGSTEGAAPEVIAEGEDGLLVGDRDVPALATAIARLCDDPEMRQRFARRGGAKVAADYVHARFAARLDELLAGLAPASRRG